MQKGCTPLHRAVVNDNVQMAELLLAKGADIEAKGADMEDEVGATPFGDGSSGY